MMKNTSLSRAENTASYEPIPELAPAHVVEIELEQPLPILEAFNEKTKQRYQRAFCVIRLHARPLGMVEIPFIEDCLAPEQYARRIWDALHAEIVDHLRQDGLPAPSGLGAFGLPCACIPSCIEVREKFYAEAPFASVIVSTRDRPERIQRCVQSLLALHYPHYEIIVVDNAPSTGATADIIQQTYRDVPQVRYAREDRPGLSSARNCGLAMARGEILAFADDDLVIDPNWLIELVQAFSIASDVVCVTGLILPLELETPPQFWFEEFGGVGKGFTRRIFDRDGNYSWRPLYPYTAGQFGSGASIAFTKNFLRRVGGFDPTLGAGSLARAGEDLAVFFQAVTGGHKIVYEPASLVYHPHHREYEDLSKQIYGYGMGLGAYLMKIVWDNPHLLPDIAMKIPYGLFFMLSARSPKNSKKLTSFPRELTAIERKGLLYGPLAYIKSWRGIRKAKHKLSHDRSRFGRNFAL